MANVKISALPSWTGTAADLRWFVMNNSGETETFKYSGYTSGVRPVSGLSNSFISINYTDSDVKCIQSQILGGSGNSIQSTDGTGRNTIIGGFDNTIPQGFNNTIINGYNASILGGQATIVGASGSITDGFNNILLGGVGIVGGNNSGIVAGYGNIISPTFNDRDFIGGGTSNYITYGSDSSIIAGVSNLIEGNSNYAVICGGQSNKFTASNYGFIGGGISNIIDNSNNSSILGGSGNTINAETAGVERFNTIIGGSNNTIFNAANDQLYQSIINSKNTTISVGAERVTGIGLSGRTLNDQLAGTTVVENLFAYRQISSGFYDNGTIGAGGLTIDVRNGDKQQLTITGSGTTQVSFIGNIAGGRLVLKVVNTSTGDIGFADNSPYDWKIPTLGIPSTANGTDVYIFESFGDQTLWFTSQSKDLV
jgi:hypothetical protein